MAFFLTPFASVLVMMMLDRDVQHPFIQSEKAARVKLRPTRMMHPIQVPWLAHSIKGSGAVLGESMCMLPLSTQPCSSRLTDFHPRHNFDWRPAATGQICIEGACGDHAKCRGTCGLWRLEQKLAFGLLACERPRIL